MARRQTPGEYLVGLDFNPSGDENVTKLKKQAAAFADTVYRLKHLAVSINEDAHNQSAGKDKDDAIERTNEMIRSYDRALVHVQPVVEFGFCQPRHGGSPSWVVEGRLTQCRVSPTKDTKAHHTTRARLMS